MSQAHFAFRSLTPGEREASASCCMTIRFGRSQEAGASCSPLGYGSPANGIGVWAATLWAMNSYASDESTGVAYTGSAAVVGGAFSGDGEASVGRTAERLRPSDFSVLLS